MGKYQSPDENNKNNDNPKNNIWVSSSEKLNSSLCLHVAGLLLFPCFPDSGHTDKLIHYLGILFVMPFIPILYLFLTP